MRAALQLAARGLGRVAPNPAVGCVIVKDGRVAARGWTRPGGRPHAESEALARAGENARGATAYVTLEPCAHQGQTPPCADALVTAGIARCVIAAPDPDPRVDGRGTDTLRAAGIEVEEGLCREEAEDLNAGFLLTRRQGRPLVTLKLATSLDGRIACATGDSRWVTGDLARRHVHAQRSRHDAVVVGSGTALADNPRLDVRLAGLEQARPWRVVLDGDLRLPLAHDLVARAGEHRSCLLVADDIAEDRLKPYRQAGMEVVALARHGDGHGHLDLRAAFAALADLGLTRVLVEGGGGLAAALLAGDLVDRILWYRAAALVGADGVAAVGPLGLKRMADAMRFVALQRIDLGVDVLEVFERSSKPWRGS
jgi:diaminohydroxyphosphoribosylaminopyrimidine deaminase/5-amino-6-(5-phosphoribosylamino)uracil reductase